MIDVLENWRKKSGSEHAVKVEWIIRRALRTLIKAGHPAALRLIGVSRDAQLKFTGLKISRKTFTLGERVEFEFKIRSLSVKSQRIVVDYIVHFMKANQSTSPKVFKLKTMVLPADGEVLIAKSHHLKKVTTRTHYPGLHRIEIQVNGRVLGQVQWRLTGETS